MPIKILHTGDWHLGKRLFKEKRLPEQEGFLAWLLETLLREKIDALVISGDIFDSPNPPHEALKLYFDFLKRAVDQSDLSVYIIAGNHDSPKFLDAPKAFLGEKQIIVQGQLADDDGRAAIFHTLNCRGEKLELVLLPFFRSFDLHNLAPIQNGEEETSLLGLTKIFDDLPAKKGPRILVAHHLFGHFEPAGSELTVALSGLSSVPLSLLEGRFDYVALGHIHKRQVLREENPRVVYAGSPLPFRFSENRNKSVEILEIGPAGDIKSAKLEIPCQRRLLSIETTRDKLENTLETISLDKLQNGREPWVEVVLELDSPEAGIADFIRETLEKNKLHLLSYRTLLHAKEQDDERSEDIQQLIHDPEALFDLFWKKRYPDAGSLPNELKEDFRHILERIPNTSRSEDDV
jgi:exonuclease SbcD